MAEYKHVRTAQILACSNPSCGADESGCNSSGCYSDARWSRMYHDEFVEIFGRCPRACTKPKEPSP